MSIAIQADAKSPGTPFHHHWNLCVGAGRANEGLRADWQEQLVTAVKECGFRYVRFHGLYHDDMFVYREEKGKPVYNFQYIDILFDRLLGIGIKPFVEFGFCPKDLASETGTVFWWKGNGAPPKDFAKWGELVRRTVEHWVARYGIEEVRTWYFEVWNEPNLNPFFRGTKSQYFELYRTSVQVIKAIDPSLRVGGPSTSNFVPDARFDGETEDVSCHKEVTEAKDINTLDWQPVWLRQFLDFCHREKLPVDFVSVHPYPTDWALDEHTTGEFKKSTREVGATPRDLALTRKIVSESPFPKAGIHCTEWSSSSSPRDFTHDFPQAATYVTRANVESIGSVDSLSYWTFTDVFEEGGAGDESFHGGFGMINLQGIPKPTYHAYRFLGQLGDEMIVRLPSGIVTRDGRDGAVSAVAWHYPAEVKQSVPGSFDTRDQAYATFGTGSPQDLQVEISGLRPGSKFVLELLDGTHGNAMAAWKEMGMPHSPSREETLQLRQAGAATLKETVSADAKGVLNLKRRLEPWSVVFLKEIRS